MKRIIGISLVTILVLVASTIYAAEEVPSCSIKDCFGKIIERQRIVRVKIQNLIGHGYLNKGKIDEALAVFEKALENAQKTPGAELGRTYRYVGFTCSIKGEYSKAIDYLKEAVKYNPKDAEAHTFLGSAYYFTDNLDGAISQYKKVKKLDPNLLRARYYLILDYEQKDEFGRMMREAKGLVKDHPQYGAGHLGLARAYRRRKMYKEALKLNQTAVIYAPYFFHAHNNLACTYNSLGEHRRAKEIRKRAWKIKPLPPPQRIVVGYTPLGFSFLRQRDFDNAIAEFGQAISMTPSDTRAYLGLAEAYLGRGKVDMALEVTGEIWKISPDSFAAYSILSKIYWYETKRRLKEVISLVLGRVSQTPERPIEAVTEEKKVEPKVAKEYPKISSSDLLKNAQKYITSGIKFEKENLFDKAEKEYKKALRINPDYAQAHYHLGIIYNLQEKYKKAKISLEKVVKLDPKGLTGKKAKKLLQAISKKVARVESEKEARALYTLAENYRINKLSEQALEKYKKVVEKYPQTSWAEKAKKRIQELKSKEK